jgi:hypothetical protein
MGVFLMRSHDAAAAVRLERVLSILAARQP